MHYMCCFHNAQRTKPFAIADQNAIQSVLMANVSRPLIAIASMDIDFVWAVITFASPCAVVLAICTASVWDLINVIVN